MQRNRTVPNHGKARQRTDRLALLCFHQSRPTGFEMTVDDLLMLLILSGFVMSSSYIVAECLSWRSGKAADVKALLLLRDLYKRVHSVTRPLIRAIRRT
jgi:hypothetical protein